MNWWKCDIYFSCYYITKELKHSYSIIKQLFSYEF